MHKDVVQQSAVFCHKKMHLKVIISIITIKQKIIIFF